MADTAADLADAALDIAALDAAEAVDVLRLADASDFDAFDTTLGDGESAAEASASDAGSGTTDLGLDTTDAPGPDAMSDAIASQPSDAVTDIPVAGNDAPSELPPPDAADIADVATATADAGPGADTTVQDAGTGAVTCLDAAGQPCVACAGASFEPQVPSEWAALADDANYLQWVVAAAQPFAGQAGLRAQWTGPHPNSTSEHRATWRFRRLYVPAAGAKVYFRLAMQVADQTCGADDLAAYVNGEPIWTQCGDGVPSAAGSPFQVVALDLKAFAGAPIDFELRAKAGIGKGNSGTIDVDEVAFVGGCAPVCLGEGFEAVEPAAFESDFPYGAATAVMATKWQAKGSGWMGWQQTTAAAHTGKRSARSEYANPPSDPNNAKAAAVLPDVLPAKGDVLRFALRTKVGDVACGGDDFAVRVAGQQVLEVCGNVPDWQLFEVPLAPWAGQVVVIEFVVQAGKGGTAAGLFELDDVAVVGQCSYSCLATTLETFSSIGSWTASSTDPISFEPWAASVAKALSAPAAAYAAFDGKAKADKIVFLTHKDWFAVPVTGAVLRYAADLTFKAPTCGVAGASPPLELGTIGYPSGTGLASHCEGTLGWQQFETELPVSLRGQGARLSLRLTKVKAAAAVDAYVDDMTVMCR